MSNHDRQEETMSLLSVDDVRARFMSSAEPKDPTFRCGTCSAEFPTREAREAHQDSTDHGHRRLAESAPEPKRPATLTFRRGAAQARAASPVRPATANQIKYLKDLVATRKPDVSEEYVASVIAQGFDRVSKAIDNLNAMPKVAEKPSVRVNRYGGRCENCGKHVEPNAGRLSKDDDDRWVVWHLDGECPVFDLGVADGYYALEIEDDEEDVRFYHLFEGSVYVIAGPEEHLLHGDTARQVVERIKVDPLAASILYGLKTEHCGRCGRRLSKKSSREAGIGPVCRTKAFV